MAVNYEEKIRRLLMINGAYFKPHAIRRGKQRIGNGFDPEKLESIFTNLEGQLYWDKDHENYQLVHGDMALAFKLKLHDNRKGLLAFVTTVIPEEDKNHEANPRFKKLKVTEYTGCSSCNQALQQIFKKRHEKILDKVNTHR